jgi:hypothetical protein
MADAMNVSPATILSASSQFEDVVDTAETIDGNVHDYLGYLGPLAGDDEYGAAFSRNFQPSIDAASQLLKGISDGMNSTVTNLKTTAGLYTKSNEVNTDLTTTLNP